MRILSVDDHELCQEGLKALFERNHSKETTFFAASDCEGALAMLTESRFDVVLLEVNLPDSQGTETVKSVCRLAPDSSVLVLSATGNEAVIRSAMNAGASGFISKGSSFAILDAAIRLVLAGGRFMPAMASPSDSGEDEPAATGVKKSPGGSDAVSAVLSRVDSSLQVRAETLSARQREVLRMVIAGKCNKIIARHLNIAEATVKGHLSAAYRALGIKNRTEAEYAAEMGHLDP